MYLKNPQISVAVSSQKIIVFRISILNLQRGCNMFVKEPQLDILGLEPKRRRGIFPSPPLLTEIINMKPADRDNIPDITCLGQSCKDLSSREEQLLIGRSGRQLQICSIDPPLSIRGADLLPAVPSTTAHYAIFLKKIIFTTVQKE